MPTSDAVRQHLVDALHADLVGPFRRAPGSSESAESEVLQIAPSSWYLTGFLAPREQSPGHDPEDEDDDLGAGDLTDDEDSPAPDPSVKRPRRLPASMGLSVLVPARAEKLTARVSWADYARHESEKEAEGKRRKVFTWGRTFRGPIELALPIRDDLLTAGFEIPSSNGLRLEGHVEKTPEGLWAVAVFLVNARKATDGPARDEAYAFQVRLELQCAEGFEGRTNRSDERSADDDEQVNDLQYRDVQEYAVGHGVSAEVIPGEARVTRVATTWIPQADVHRVIPRPLPGLAVGMEVLADLKSGAEAKKALLPLVSAYGEWIAEQRKRDVGDGPRKATQAFLMDNAARANERIREGIELLASNDQVLRAFTLMNGAMAQAERKARPSEAPEWRLFQLAFILLNLPSLDKEGHPDRKRVELIFFPTGGGKTQAYLGVIAFTMLLRRLRGASRPDAGLGIAVFLRYTLRLLTLDQLGRAATLICALELLRQKTPELGEVRFSIGLWVGKSATANTLEQVAKQVTEYKSDPSPRAQSPFPLTHCPWCQTELRRDGFSLVGPKAHPEDVLVGCASLDCPFNLGRNRDGLPVLFVDEQVYRELPAFLIATVDKFALLPWRGESGMLMGRALARTSRDRSMAGVFLGPCDSPAAIKAAKVQLPKGLMPPDLIVQDELHLISGPLGTMVGLYEAAILTLCPDAKVLASTATVRRARQQVERLYGREVALFPPPGVDASETFFAQAEKKSGARRYVGVAAPGRPAKTVLLRTYVSLVAAAARQHDGSSDGSSGADPYLTLVGYFNSLRELGGMRRLVEDEVRKRVAKIEQRRPVDFDRDEDHPWYRNRSIKADPVELTSREKTLAIKEAKSRLGLHHGASHSVDVVLASNMISVGVDIDRLGLMCISGQPKTTAEYIQASSRVGRKASKPGLVVTCFNIAKPRDRSHYERFGTYHESFYRFVEATSVTPFSGPALDRGLPAVVVALGRLFETAMTAPAGLMLLEQRRKELEALLLRVADRAARDFEEKEESDRARDSVTRRAKSLLDSWQRIIASAKSETGQRVYSRLDPAGQNTKPLLHAALDDLQTLSEDERRFIAPLSMRDVEPSVHLWVQRIPLGGLQPKKAEPETSGA